MRLSSITALIVLATALHGCVLSGSRRVMDRPDEAKSPGEAILQALVALGASGTSRTSPAAALDDLEMHEPTADAKERELIQTLIPVLEKVADKGEQLGPADHRSVLDVMGRVAQTKPKDFEVQYAMTTGMFAMETALNASGSVTAQTGESRAKDLTARFPNEARAHAHLGHVASLNDPPLAMRSFARCLRLDPGIVGCKTGLKAVADGYQQPRCAGGSFRKLTLHPAYEANAETAKLGRKGLRPIKLNKRLLLMEEQPALDGGMVDEATSSGTGNDQQLTLAFSPRGAGTLADVTARLAERRGYLAVVVAGKVRAAPQVISAIEAGTVMVTGISLEEICAKVEKRPLPKEVQGLL